MNEIKYSSIDHYITDAPAEVKQILINIRCLISEIAPEAVSCIAYNMPAFKYHKKPLVYFAAFKNHIGFYALPSGNVAFQKELTKYKTGKGSIQFPLDQEIPYDLIGQLVEFRVAEMNDALSQKS